MPLIKKDFPHIRILDILHGQGGEKEGGGFPRFSAPYDPCIDIRITINYYLKKYIIHNYNISQEKIKVIHNGIDYNFFYKNSKNKNKFRKRFKLKSEDFCVGFIGRLSYEKHPEKILQIASMLKENEHIKFIIAGSGPLENELKQISIDEKLNNIIFLGYIEDVKNLLADLNLLLLVSEMEGLPIVLLEAMSMQVPCIASNVGGIPELIDNDLNGYLVEYDDDMIKNFAEKILFLQHNKNHYNLFSSNSRKKIMKDFSIKHMINGYCDIF